jgi:hypothetical protein
MVDEKAAPLLDLLRRVPADARLVYEHSPTEHSFIPVGRLFAEAVTEIEALRQRVAELEQLLKVAERQYADAIEGFAKMQQEGYLCRGHFNRSEPCPDCVPLYRKGE